MKSTTHGVSDAPLHTCARIYVTNSSSSGKLKDECEKRRRECEKRRCFIRGCCELVGHLPSCSERTNSSLPIDKYAHFPSYDPHTGKWIECDCGADDCDTKKFADDLQEEDFEANGWCQIFDQYCEGFERVRKKCKICLKRACENCSLRTSRLSLQGFPRGRYCHECLTKYGEDAAVDDHFDDLCELYGYDMRDEEEPVKLLKISSMEIL